MACRSIALLGAPLFLSVALPGMTALAPRQIPSFVSSVVASPAGEACRKEICDSAVAACLRADLSLNPFAHTEAEKKAYCAQFFLGCMTRSVYADVPWYSPETVDRFLSVRRRDPWEQTPIPGKSWRPAAYAC
jgi:hypothetical protein